MSPSRSSSSPAGGILISVESTIAIPAAFFTDVLPEITAIEELQATLAIFRLLADQGGIDHPIAERAVVRDRLLRTAMRVEGSPREPDLRIAKGLDLATARGTLLRLDVGTGRRSTVWYYVNTVENRSTLAAVQRGAIAPPQALWADDAETPPDVQIERPNAFRLYEQNIGALTPLIADQIIRAIEEYPADWIEDAIVEAVSYNRRSWRYITRILESWQTNGRGETGA
ncbi:MAG: DnaD domain protein [Thermomicrobiales bacterium]